MPPRPLAALVSILMLTACAAAPPEDPRTVRQALFGLGQRAVQEVAKAPALPRPAVDQVLLLSPPLVDPTLGIDRERLLESLTRALLGLEDGPQVLDWQPALPQGGNANQWRLDSRLVAAGPRLSLSDRALLPYRLQLTLRRPGTESPLWQSHIDGALDASAL